MPQQLLEAPVEYGDVRLAPTVELAGLAELAEMADHESQVDALVRIAAAVRAEDEARAHLARLRTGEIPVPELPRRSA
jgi:hypothetical protein